MQRLEDEYSPSNAWLGTSHQVAQLSPLVALQMEWDSHVIEPEKSVFAVQNIFSEANDLVTCRILRTQSPNDEAEYPVNDTSWLRIG